MSIKNNQQFVDKYGGIGVGVVNKGVGVKKIK
jgi:hypothetical protein